MKTELVPQPVLYLPKNSLESFKNYHFEFSSVVNVLGELFYENKNQSSLEKIIHGESFQNDGKFKKISSNERISQSVSSDLKTEIYFLRLLMKNLFVLFKKKTIILWM